MKRGAGAALADPTKAIHLPPLFLHVCHCAACPQRTGKVPKVALRCGCPTSAPGFWTLEQRLGMLGGLAPRGCSLNRNPQALKKENLGSRSPCAKRAHCLLCTTCLLTTQWTYSSCYQPQKMKLACLYLVLLRARLGETRGRGCARRSNKSHPPPSPVPTCLPLRSVPATNWEDAQGRSGLRLSDLGCRVLDPGASAGHAGRAGTSRLQLES